MSSSPFSLYGWSPERSPLEYPGGIRPVLPTAPDWHAFKTTTGILPLASTPSPRRTSCRPGTRRPAAAGAAPHHAVPVEMHHVERLPGIGGLRYRLAQGEQAGLGGPEHHLQAPVPRPLVGITAWPGPSGQFARTVGPGFSHIPNGAGR